MKITFRLAKPEDLTTLVPLIRAFYVVDQHDFDETLIIPALHTLLAEPRYGRVWFMLADNAVAGYVILTFGFALESGGRDALIDEFYISDAFRGQGIGKQTVAFLRDFCRSEGIRVLYLEVEKHNNAAFAFYERVGFAADNSTFMSMDVT